MKKKTKKRVRRAQRYVRGNMDVSAALLRCALACSAFIVTAGALSVTGAYGKWPQWLSLLVQLAMTLLCFGLPAVRGLFFADGDQRDKLCRRALSAAQLLPLLSAGALLVCPMTLLNDLIMAPFVRMGIASAAGETPGAALFLPMLVKSALIAPVCEELFFRGYLYAVLKEAGLRSAGVFVTLFFALVHGVDAMFLPRLLMGFLLLCLMLRTESLLAPVLVHAVYNLTVLLLSFAGLGGLFSSIGFVSCVIRLFGCAAFVVALKQAYAARGVSAQFTFGRRLTVLQSMLVSAALAMLVYFPILFTILDGMGAAK